MKWLTIALLALWLTACASENDNAEAAQQAATQWLQGNTETWLSPLAERIAKATGVADFEVKPVLKTALDASGAWQYQAVKEKTDRWRVTATAAAEIKLPSQTVKLDGQLTLLINTKNSSVIQRDFKAESFQLAVTTSTTTEAAADNTVVAPTNTLPMESGSAGPADIQAFRNEADWEKKSNFTDFETYLNYKQRQKDGPIVQHVGILTNYIEEGKKTSSYIRVFSCNCADKTSRDEMQYSFSEAMAGGSIKEDALDDYDKSWRELDDPDVKYACQHACQ